MAACFNLVRNVSSRSGKDVLSLLNWVIFNYLIGNSDAHGKNISLLLLAKMTHSLFRRSTAAFPATLSYNNDDLL
ncbi:MAG: HipA domain-containing protein [Deltaproteobacteria bacterium]|nr:HipA domain-containing protein [Deltaproteobacteria bacterium]